MNKSIIPWLAILLFCVLFFHHQRENEHQLAFDRVKAMAQVAPASIDISQASSACQDYLDAYPQRRESEDVHRWLGEIEKEKVRREENIRLAKVEQQRQLAEAERLKEQERVANLPENLFAKAKNLLGSNDHDAIPLLERASQGGSAAASFELAHIYAKGLYGKRADEQSMVGWLSKAEAQGHSRAGKMLRQRKEQTEWFKYLSNRYATDRDSWSPDPSTISPDDLKRGISELTTALREYKAAASYSKESARYCLNNLLEISKNGGATGDDRPSVVSGASLIGRFDTINAAYNKKQEMEFLRDAQKEAIAESMLNGRVPANAKKVGISSYVVYAPKASKKYTVDYNYDVRMWQVWEVPIVPH